MIDRLPERLREGLGRRAAAIAATLALEALLVAILLTLGISKEPKREFVPLVTTFDAGNEPEKQPEAPEPRQASAPVPNPAPQQPDVPQPQPQAAPLQTAPQPAATQPPLLPMSKSDLAQFDISNLPKGQATGASGPASTYGPPNTGNPGDSKRVGTAPNGQPMYAASWFRRPYPGELDGYLSTADHPGWGIIACETAPENRVINCEFVDEYPAHSNYGRAVLAAAWQFKIRPPRIGGKPVYGTWVRIKIYDDTGNTGKSNAE